MDQLFQVIYDLNEQIDELRREMEEMKGDTIHPFYVGRVTESIADKERGKINLQTVKDTGGSLDLADRAFSVRAYNGTGESLSLDDKVNVARDSWGVWHVVSGAGGGDGVIVPVTLTQTGGTQGDGTNPATWTYDITPALDPSAGVVMSAQDPVSAPHHYERPNVGQVEKANFGLAWRKSIDPAPEPPAHPYEYELTWINEAIIGAICEEEEAP